MASTDPVAPGSKLRHFSWTITDDGASVTCKAVSLAGAPERTFSIADVHSDLLPTLAAYGLKQVLSDRVAQVKTTGEKLADMEEVFSNFHEGVWSEARQGGTGPSNKPTLLMLSVSRAFGADAPIEKVMEKFHFNADAMAEKDYKAWKKGYSADERVKAAMASIQAERAKAAAKAAKGTESKVDALADFGTAAEEEEEAAA
jgi:hypothetical protein